MENIKAKLIAHAMYLQAVKEFISRVRYAMCLEENLKDGCDSKDEVNSLYGVATYTPDFESAFSLLDQIERKMGGASKSTRSDRSETDEFTNADAIRNMTIGELSVLLSSTYFGRNRAEILNFLSEPYKRFNWYQSERSEYHAIVELLNKYVNSPVDVPEYTQAAENILNEIKFAISHDDMLARLEYCRKIGRRESAFYRAPLDDLLDKINKIIWEASKNESD